MIGPAHVEELALDEGRLVTTKFERARALLARSGSEGMPNAPAGVPNAR